MYHEPQWKIKNNFDTYFFEFAIDTIWKLVSWFYEIFVRVFWVLVKVYIEFSARKTVTSSWRFLFYSLTKQRRLILCLKLTFNTLIVWLGLKVCVENWIMSIRYKNKNKRSVCLLTYSGPVISIPLSEKACEYGRLKRLSYFINGQIDSSLTHLVSHIFISYSVRIYFIILVYTYRSFYQKPFLNFIL